VVVEEQAPRCANHPSVETWVSCSSCGKPICPDCMVQAPVGIKCRTCARMPRSAQVRLKPDRAARAAAVALALGLVIGVALSALPGSYGFFAFIVAYFVGRGMGSAVKRGSGYYRGQTSAAIAAFGCLVAYISPVVLAPLIYGEHHSAQLIVFDVVLGSIAAFIAYREVA
jgi:hypothetical protein